MGLIPCDPEIGPDKSHTTKAGRSEATATLLQLVVVPLLMYLHSVSRTHPRLKQVLVYGTFLLHTLLLCAWCTVPCIIRAMFEL